MNDIETAATASNQLILSMEKFLEINNHIPDEALKHSGEIVVDGYSMLKMREAHRNWEKCISQLIPPKP